MKSKNTIEFNGTRYDTQTGAIVGASQTASAKKGNIDGFFRNPRQANTTVLAAPRTKPQPIVALLKPSMSSDIIGGTKRTARTIPVNHVKHHTAQHSATLMRKSVKKPSLGLKKQVNVQHQLATTTPALIVTKQSVYSPDETRLERAKQTARSPHVTRHADTSRHAPAISPLAVRPMPVKPEAGVPIDAPAPSHTDKPMDIFEQAMANASNFVDVKAHSSHIKRHTRRHLATMGAGAFALLLIGGFVTYTNSPSLQLKVASIRAGVGTTPMPDFKAAGFTYAGSKPKSGALTLGFSDANGDYQLTQQPTNWDSQDLIDNVGSVDASGFPTYTTLRTSNTMVYRLGNNSATWISKGVWYQLSGTGALSDDQVANLVKNI